MRRLKAGIGVACALLVCVVLLAHTASAESYAVTFCRYGPKTSITTTFQLRTPLRSGTSDTFPNVNSKWNQPRSEGWSNPHQGVDLHALMDTPLYPVWRGWVEYASEADCEIVIYLDLDADTQKDDYAWVKYDHLNGVEVSVGQFVNSGTLIGYTGDEYGEYPPHLHFGVMRQYSPTTHNGQWAPMERYYPQGWNAGKDLDFICRLHYSGSSVHAIAYAHDEFGQENLPEGYVTIYHRLRGDTDWMADTMSLTAGSETEWQFNLASMYSSGDVVQYMVVAERDIYDDYVWGIFPAKLEQPAVPPDTSYTYDYITFTVP